MNHADHKHVKDASKTNATDKPLAWHDNDMPFSQIFQDHFYSKADGRAECDHVFIAANNLVERWKAGADFSIGELGFGTGLNFCETYHHWKKERQPGALLEFFSFELYPMAKEDIKKALSHWPEIADERDALLEQWPNTRERIITIDFDCQTRLSVLCGDALESLSPLRLNCDAWFLDGFAPSRNPDMWSQSILKAVFENTVTGGTFGTYTVAGFVRRNLAEVGFNVTRRPGFANKREMLSGVKD